MVVPTPQLSQPGSVSHGCSSSSRGCSGMGPTHTLPGWELGSSGMEPTFTLPCFTPWPREMSPPFGDPAASPVLPTGAQAMMLLLLAPSSPLPHPIHHLACHLPAGQRQQDRCPRPQRRGWRPAGGPGSSGTAPGEGDTMSPGRGGRAEQRPGTRMGRDSLGGAAPCSWHAPALLCTSHLWIYLPVPRLHGLCHCHTPRCCKAHGLTAEPNRRNF